jgi:hypothetical protein
MTNRSIALGAGLVTAAGSLLLLRFGQGGWHLPAWSAGMILSLTQGVIALWISAQAVGLNTARFFGWGLGLHAVRLGVVFGILVLVRVTGWVDFFPFLTVVLWGYVVFMAGEVWSLHANGLRSSTAAGMTRQGSTTNGR